MTNIAEDIFTTMIAQMYKDETIIEEQKAEIKRLREALQKIEYLDSPQVRGLPRRVSIHEIARDALKKQHDLSS